MSKSSAASRAATQPWVEKYRPQTVDDVVYQEEVVRALKSALTSGSLPHLLFYGPAGTGKTSTILAVAKQLFGPELYKSRVMELNASDDRGIKVVREKIKSFAQIAVSSSASANGEYPVPPFKLIILDEADAMTTDAQSALRRTMETYSKVTRFCLLCNYVSRIIEPITSRCAKFRFRPLERTSISGRLMHIAERERVTLTPEALGTLMDLAEGDLRRAITLLQSAHRMYSTSEEGVTPNRLMDMAGVVPPERLKTLWTNCCSEYFEQMQKSVDTVVVAEGYPATQVLSQLLRIANSDESGLSDLQKARISLKAAQVEKCLADGADEFLQMLSFCSVIMKAVSSGAGAADAGRS